MICVDEHAGTECGKSCPCLCDPCMDVAVKRRQQRAGRRSRRKGKLGQKMAAAEISQILELEDGELFSSGGGRESDLRGSQVFQQKFGFRPEVKNERNVRMADWIEQAEVDNHMIGKVGVPWILIFKLHGSKKLYATLKLSELLKLVKRKVKE